MDIAPTLLSLLGIEHDLGGLQFLHVVVEAADLEGVRRVETMAIRDIARPNAVDLEVAHDRLLGLGTEGADDRLQRAYPAQRIATLAVGVAISQALRT